MAEENKTVENQEVDDIKEQTINEEVQDAEETDNVTDKELKSEQLESEELESEETDEESGDEKKGFKKLFGKKDDKEAKYKEQIDELNDRVVRQMAEFENYRKRTEKEKQQMFETGAKSVIEKILPVIDNFERGFASIPEEEKDSSFVEGMNMVYKQLMTELEKLEVKPIEAVGKEFDPNFHNAVMHIEDENLGEGIVAQELQKGYMYRDSVVRHSMVQVAN